jgi:cytochrome c-type biogenesis protein CcmH
VAGSILGDAPAGRLYGAALLLILLVLPVAIMAQQVSHPDAKERAVAAIGELRSPYCPGLMLEVCPSAPAAALRDSIHDMAGAGETTAAIVEWVLARHGEEWRAVPKRSGAGLWAWVVPPLVLLVAGVLLAFRLRGIRSLPPAPAPAPLSPEEEAELSAAMRDWERAGAGS